MRIALLPILVITLGACADRQSSPLGPSRQTLPDRASFAKPVPNLRARFEYQTVAYSANSGRLIGDLRGATGGPSLDPSIYADGECGVTAQIFVSGSGDATMDPIGSSPTCPPARSLTVEFGRPLAGVSFGTITGGHFSNVRDVLSLATEGSGDERRFRLMFRNFPGAGCDYLRYENPEGLDGQLGTSDDVSYGGFTGDNILVTRQPDEGGKRVWLAESQAVGGRHVAFCEKTGKRNSTYVGAYDIPFRVKVIEQ